jgi:ParB family chromosome partitioning protein
MTATAVPLEREASEELIELVAIPLDQLHESPDNPRKHYEPTALAQLAENLKAVGQITPAVVRPRSGGGYELAAGHRRFRATKLAGLPTLLAIVKEMDEAQFIEILNIENLQRDDLNALEEAQGFVALMTGAGYDVPKIAERVGKSVKYVYDRIKLLQLIPPAKKLLLEGTITAGHGILLARLTKEDQARAIEPREGFRGGGGVLEAERVDEQYFPETKKDEETEGPVKAVSVRELDQWIARNVRFVPDKVDQTDLAFDLPQTAELLETAAQSKLKVIKITREYRVSDDARDAKERTIGAAHWKRADGELEEVDRWSRAEPKPSKTCERSVVGLVVAGPGRGEAFLVCVNKEKCTVHWPEEVKARAQRAKEKEAAAAKAPAGNGQAPAVKEPKVDPNLVPYELRQRWVKEELATRAPAIVKDVKALIAELKISDEICWNLAVADLQFFGWYKIGKQSNQYGGSGGLDSEPELEVLLAPELPGRFRKGALEPEDGPAARSVLAWRIWLARDGDDLDESIDKAVTARWTAHRKAQTSATAKKPARAKKGVVGKKGKRSAKGG